MSGNGYLKFRNDRGVPEICIGVREFECIGVSPPQDHPHIYIDMGEADTILCPYCGTRFRFDPRLAPLNADPPDSFFADHNAACAEPRCSRNVQMSVLSKLDEVTGRQPTGDRALGLGKIEEVVERLNVQATVTDGCEVPADGLLRRDRKDAVKSAVGKDDVQLLVEHDQRLANSVRSGPNLNRCALHWRNARAPTRPNGFLPDDDPSSSGSSLSSSVPEHAVGS
jgi:uncharacterized Zn-finger protein